MPVQADDRVVLDDGRVLNVRPIRPDDTERLQQMHRGLSPRTVRLRFFSPVPELTSVMADRFTHVDGTDRVALVAAEPDGALVGVARYDRLDDRHCVEVAVVVADAYQHHGLGTALLRRLLDRAREVGITEVVAEVLVGNRAMLHTLTDVGLTTTSECDVGVLHVHAQL